MLFEIKSENSLGFIYHTHEKTFFIYVICVGRGDVVFLDFLANLSLLATKLRGCAQTYQLKICFIPRCIICSPSCYVKAIKPGATKVTIMAFNEAIRLVPSNLYFRYILSEILDHSQGRWNAT